MQFDILLVSSRWRMVAVFLIAAVLVSAAAVIDTQYETIQGHDCFRNLKGMTESMFDLEVNYPELLSVSDIGDSYLKSTNDNNDEYPLPQNGYDIYAMNITSSDSERKSSRKGKTLIISGVHAREYAPPELAMRFAEMLLKGYGVDSDITWILRRTEVHFILHVNPDGRYVAETYPSTSWRKNLNPGKLRCPLKAGVDINRNFDFMWGDLDGASDYECDNTYHGRFPESEPETRAVVEYAKLLFPEDQRKEDPEDEIDIPLGEDIMGLFVDIHSSGGYIYYPWGHKDEKSVDDEALQALGRKINYFNGYKIWAGGQPDFQYASSGDSSDYMYAVFGVATFGLEVGEEFDEDCDLFEDEIIPLNLPALLYAAKTATRPFSLTKGPDILDLQVTSNDGLLQIRASASDSLLVNNIEDFPDFVTGDQRVDNVYAYLVHPDDFNDGDLRWTLQPISSNSDVLFFEIDITLPRGLTPGRHILYAQAKDSDGYAGPVKSVFFEYERKETTSPSQYPTSKPSYPPATPLPSVSPTRKNSSSPSLSPNAQPTAIPSMQPSVAPVSTPSASPTRSPSNSPKTIVPSGYPTSFPTSSPSSEPTSGPPSFEPTSGPTSTPTKSPVREPTENPSSSPTTADPTSKPSISPSIEPKPSAASISTSVPTTSLMAQLTTVSGMNETNTKVPPPFSGGWSTLLCSHLPKLLVLFVSVSWHFA